ncbi:Trehalase [Folsomia candida]|uniref:Trehalase n=1 Tax=Folsomia candida TaxID=158441 RepID=A0A226DK25_FOLCA|nr:Trehalase [Folsomia candida]
MFSKTFVTFWASVLLLQALCVTKVDSQSADDYPLPCSSEIYCHGPLLETVQLSRRNMTDASKSFVDMSLRHSPEDILASFARLNFTGDVSGNATQLDQLNVFLAENFAGPGTEFENITFPDWTDSNSIPFFDTIVDPDLKDWAVRLHSIWNELGRQIIPSMNNSDRTSIIYSPNPVVVPGERFREFYYWDSYWIQRGLLVSDMANTVKGMIENFLDFVDRPDLGYVPNGGRIYYERSQPPLLIPMIEAYYNHSGDDVFIRENFAVMQKEFQFWMQNRTVTFEKDGANFTMARYAVDRKGPRPEAFQKEFDQIDPLDISNTTKNEIYSHLKSACNFSSTRTRDIIPVDLNAFLYWNAVLLQRFCLQVNIPVEQCAYYGNKADELKTAIHQVLWDEGTGSWYDYDYVRGTTRKDFYTSNLTPLWAKAHHDAANVLPKVINYLETSGALDYPAGIPTSLRNESFQQWDFPNAWPPLVHMVVEALENSGNENASRIAFKIAQDWTDANYIGFKVSDEAMFEKYDVRIPGCRGSGGYYETVLGFGWTNGVILDFFQKYGDRLVAPVVPENLQCGDVTNAQSQLIPVNGVYLIAQFFHIVTYFIYRLI